MYHGIFYPNTQKPVGKKQLNEEIDSSRDDVDPNDMKEKLNESKQKCYFFEEDSKLAWRRVRNYEELLSLKDEERNMLHKKYQNYEINLRRFQAETNYLNRTNKFFGDMNTVFVSYAKEGKPHTPSITREYEERFKDLTSQMQVISLTALKFAETEDDMRIKTGRMQ